MAEALNIQILLNEQGVKVVYLDGLKFSCNLNRHLGWAKKGIPGHKTLFPSSFQSSIMISFSNKKIQGAIATPNTYNSKKNIYFIKNLSYKISDRYALVWDNARIHKSIDVIKFIEQHRLCIAWITTYWSFVNHCERLILIINTKMRAIERTCRDVNLAKFKNWVDQIKQTKLIRCIRESFEETLTLTSQ